MFPECFVMLMHTCLLTCHADIAYRGSKNSVKAGLDNQTGPDIATCMEDRDSKRPILIRAWYILFWHALITPHVHARARGYVIVTPRAHAQARGYVIGRGVYILLYIIYYKSALFLEPIFYLPKYSLSEVQFNTDRLLIEFNGLWYSLAARQVFVAITNPDNLSFG